MSENQYFNKALNNFIQDFANGGQIRHLADRGLTVAEIMQKLDVPASKDTVANIVWKHYIDTGKIRLEKPDEGGKVEKVSYVKQQGAYGKISMRRVVTEIDTSDKKYVECTYGKQLYQDKAALLSRLEILSERDKSYILDLPWPLTPVYHELDERMSRISLILDSHAP